MCGWLRTGPGAVSFIVGRAKKEALNFQGTTGINTYKKWCNFGSILKFDYCVLIKNSIASLLLLNSIHMCSNDPEWQLHRDDELRFETSQRGHLKFSKFRSLNLCSLE